jgi:hypothetical protein
MDFIQTCIGGDLDTIIEAFHHVPLNRKGREKLKDGINKLIEHNHYDAFVGFCTKELHSFINLYWSVCNVCAEHNRFDMLKHSHGLFCNKTSCLERSIHYAIKHNNFEMLEYLVSQEEISRMIQSDSFDSTLSAAEFNNMNMLVYLHQKGFRILGSVCWYAAKNRNMEMLQFAHDHGIEFDKNTMSYACKGGSLEIVMYLRNNGCPWNQWACTEASRFGHIHILTYLHENGCVWNSGAISAACVSDDPENLECLEYAFSHGCLIDDWAAINCGIFGSNIALDYVISKNGPLTVYAISEATKRGDLQMVMKLREHGCPWDSRVTYWAKEKGHNAIYDYAIANECALPEPDREYEYCILYDYPFDD